MNQHQHREHTAARKVVIAEDDVEDIERYDLGRPARPGPPVNVMIASKVLSVMMVIRIMLTRIAARNCGRVMKTSCCVEDAPSTSAAS